ncbi:MAG: DUF892 family protein [Methylobacteriaceae bacterium]|nr:DUF892 family protein [Methylobacteriaceae bacterium]
MNQASKALAGRSSTHRLSRGLGMFGIGLGLAELLVPGALARWLGVPGSEQALQLYGLREGREKDDASADLALISTAQRVENYEIAGYTIAKNLAQQIHNMQIMQLLTESLGEEQNADQLLDQAAASLMSVAKMPVSIA